MSSLVHNAGHIVHLIRSSPYAAFTIALVVYSRGTRYVPDPCRGRQVNHTQCGKQRKMYHRVPPCTGG